MDVTNSTIVVLLYFLSMISTNFNIIIDRMIGAPGHGKDVVDGINACDNRYMMGKICMIGTQEVDNKESMIGSAS